MGVNLRLINGKRVLVAQGTEPQSGPELAPLSSRWDSLVGGGIGGGPLGFGFLGGLLGGDDEELQSPIYPTSTLLVTTPNSGHALSKTTSRSKPLNAHSTRAGQA